MDNNSSSFPEAESWNKNRGSSWVPSGSDFEEEARFEEALRWIRQKGR